MSRVSVKNGTGVSRQSGSTSKYDANNKVLSQTYGAFADLRRELLQHGDFPAVVARHRGLGGDGALMQALHQAALVETFEHELEEGFGIETGFDFRKRLREAAMAGFIKPVFELRRG